jgi:small subunit ribosomal protein S9
MAETKFYKGVGRRKTAIASVRVYPKGKGVITVNGKPLDERIPEKDRQEILKAPLKLISEALDISIKVIGGGKKGQAEAIRHGLSRAIIKMDEAYRPGLKAEGYLARDARKKERKKPGLKKARRAKQWRKR